MGNIFKSITPLGWVVIALVVAGSLFGVHQFLQKHNVLDKAQKKLESSKLAVNKDADIVLAYNTFPGMEGILYMNGGMEPNVDSRLFKEYGIKLQIKKMDVVADTRDGLKAGVLDLVYCTTDALPIEMSSGSQLVELKVKEIMKVNESRGADAIVVNKSIIKVSDLKGKKVAYAVGTASNTLLINVLETSGLKTTDIDAYKVADGVEAANAFKAGQCDAAVVWAPDDEDCVAAIPGSKVLISTSTATQIIADGLLVTADDLNAKRDQITKVVKAWLIGNGLINSSTTVRKEANALFAKGFDFPEAVAALSSDKIRFSTLQDNKNFFGFDPTFTGVTGDKMYDRMAVKYTEQGLARSPAAWRVVSDGSVIEQLLKDQSLVNDPNQSEAAVPVFTPPTQADIKVAPQGTKVITLNFATGASSLDETAIAVINREVASLAQGFANARIRVEGNTDNVGNAAFNKSLSDRRAQAVVDYLVSEYKFNRNKFIVVGNGSGKPVAGCEANADEACRARNRRTDFNFIWK
jgi:NitT/TauT family transport system substrate-binding protein